MKYLLLFYACFSAGTALAANFDKDWAQFDKDFERLNQRYAAPRAKPDTSPPSQAATASPEPASGEDAPDESADHNEPEANTEKTAEPNKGAL